MVLFTHGKFVHLVSLSRALICALCDWWSPFLTTSCICTRQLHSNEPRNACHVWEISRSCIRAVSTCVLPRSAGSTGGVIWSSTKLYCQCFLSALSWTLFPKEYSASQYWRCLFWNNIPSPLFNDTSGKLGLTYSESLSLDDPRKILFGLTSFFALLQDMVPTRPGQSYVPRVYGFRVNKSSLYYRNREEDQREKKMESTSRQSRRSRRQGRK